MKLKVKVRMKIKKTRKVSVRLTEEQYRTFKDSCAAVGIDRSSGFRKLIVLLPDLLKK